MRYEYGSLCTLEAIDHEIKTEKQADNPYNPLKALSVSRKKKNKKSKKGGMKRWK